MELIAGAEGVAAVAVRVGLTTTAGVAAAVGAVAGGGVAAGVAGADVAFAVGEAAGA